MSDNGYTSLEEIEREFTKVRYVDREVCGKRFKLRSWTAEECQAFLSAMDKHPRTMNQRIIIGVVEEPKFTRADIERLSRIDGAFIAKLAKECMEHVGIDGLDDVEDEEKN
jgi:hypothetical protein